MADCSARHTKTLVKPVVVAGPFYLAGDLPMFYIYLLTSAAACMILLLLSKRLLVSWIPPTFIICVLFTMQARRDPFFYVEFWFALCLSLVANLGVLSIVQRIIDEEDN